MIAQAAELIRTRGLAKRCLEDPETGALCIHGALNVAAGLPNTNWTVLLRTSAPWNQEMRALKTVIQEQFPERSQRVLGVADFNDHWATTEDDVILVLEKAALVADDLSSAPVTDFPEAAA